jgi:hypothetical protein
VRLALFSQRFLIHQHAIGWSKNSFIQPFGQAVYMVWCLEFYPVALLIGLLTVATKKSNLSLIQNNERLLLLLGALIIIEFLLLFPAPIEVSKYLRVSLDELY